MSPIGVSPLRVLWIEQSHPGLGYYDALQHELSRRGHNVTVWSKHRKSPRLNHALIGMDVALVAFGWFHQESGRIPHISQYLRNQSDTSPAARNDSLCGRIPLVVMLNKEYVLMTAKLEWIRIHCVHRALTVHHHAGTFAANTSTPFTRFTFGVDIDTFARGTGASISTAEPDDPNPPHPPQALALPNARGGGAGGVVSTRARGMKAALAAAAATAHEYEHDIGFTGVIRGAQTANWRFRIWREAWPRLAAHKLRLYSGPQGGVHIGVAHVSLNTSEYVRQMRASKMWLSTTGPADLVGTRYFEVMATGTTLCVCNRMSDPSVYGSLGIREGVHVAMFSTLGEFEQLVRNFSSPDHEQRRMSIVRRAQALAQRKFSWQHVGATLEKDLAEAATVGDSGL